MPITKRAVEDLKPGNILWDAGKGSVVGFGARRQTNARVFILKFARAGRSRWYTIGKYGAPWTVDQARTEAKRLLGEVAGGHDPSRRRRQSASADILVSDFCDSYLAAATAGLVLTRFNQPKRPSTLAIDRGRINRHINPLIGDMAVRDVSAADVRQLVADVASGKTATDVKTRKRGRAIVKGGPGAAARTADLLSGILAWAVDQQLIAHNPVHGVRRFRAEARDRYLSNDELAQLGKQLTRASGHSADTDRYHPYAVVIINLLCLTGCRLGEISALRWQEVDSQDQCLRLTMTKTGRSMRAVGTEALSLLARQPKLIGSEFVFPGSRGTTYYQGTKTAVRHIFRSCGIVGATSHTLRHTFASVASRLGYSDATIGGLLGHAGRGVTSRYIHRPDSALAAAANHVCNEIATIMAVQTTTPGNTDKLPHYHQSPTAQSLSVKSK